MHTAIYPFHSKNMHELLQFRIPKGKKDNIFLYYFFTLRVELLLLFRAQKQRKAWVGRGPLELLVQTSVRSQGHRLGYSEICQAESFKIFSDINFTSVLGNLFQCLSQGAYFFHIARQHFPWATCTCCLLFCHCASLWKKHPLLLCTYVLGAL